MIELCFLTNLKVLCLKGTLEILREDISILYKNADRPNVYSQRRLLKEPVDVM